MLGSGLGGKVIPRLALFGMLCLRWAGNDPGSSPVAYPSQAGGISETLRTVYPLAWGAPSGNSNSFQVDLDPAARVYARLSAHYLAQPLRQDFPSVAPLARRQAWQGFPPWGTGAPEEIFIATDGSGEVHGGWAFAVWTLWQGRWYRHGWDGGAGHRTPWLLPSTSQDTDLRSYFGELGALTSAALWLTAWWDCLRVSTGVAPKRVTVAVDNTAALGVAAGRAATTHPQAQVCRSVWQAVQSRLSTDFRHVPGHHGVLVNEVADFLAGYAARHPRAASVGYTKLEPQVAQDLVQEGPLLWLLPTAQLLDECLIWSPPGTPAQAESKPAPPATAPASVPPVAESPKVVRSLQVVQANVQTISDVEPSFFNRAGHGQRRIYFSRQLRELGVHVAFLQECRSRAGRWASHGFLSWRGGHVKGCYGVEIWVSPVCVDPPLQLDHWRICVSQPRLLVIRCVREDMPMTLVSAHAPHAERPLEEIRSFWNLLQEQLRVARRDGPVLVGIDANADLLAPDEQGTLVGSLLADRQPRPGDDFLLQTVVEAGLFAAGTWPEIHQGPTWTWQHTSGKRQRLDHILLSQDVRVTSHSQLPDFDIVTKETATAVAGLPSRPPLVRRQPYISDEAAEVLSDLRDARAEVRRLRGCLD